MRDLCKKAKMTIIDQKRHVSQWQKSSMTAAAYCRRHSLNYASFHYWLKKYKAEDNHPGKFIEIQASDNKNNETQRTEIVLPNGVRIFYAGELSVTLVKSLLDV
jgi:uncharacterized Rmd1/YagE family protein